ncbi:hypothetical protein [Jiangella muralis]|uniref:hypothetical protein n=1 Tax=Jiangella muralis TaxID=702383 RepID=UPI00069DEB9C|nr:hypothetical protein [Jiangella muralis]
MAARPALPGVWIGTVTRLDGPAVYVTVPRLSAKDYEYGPCNAVAAGGPYVAGARVLVAPLEGRRDDVAVLGVLQ